MDGSNADYVYNFASSSVLGLEGQKCFAACLSGLKRSDDCGRTWYNAYAGPAFDSSAPTLAVVVAPDFANEHLIVAGLAGGFLRSEDNGQHWEGIVLPSPPPTVSAMAISPNFSSDGIIFAATLEDGVFCSNNRGQTWAAWNFGLLDLNVFCLALSPAFACDETLLAGTESGIFRSTNGGRAWRELNLPCGFATVLALSFSPNYVSDGVIYAGTEASGIFCLDSSGSQWKRISCDSLTGAIASICPYLNGLLVVHNGEVLITQDGNNFIPWQAEALKDVKVSALVSLGDRKTIVAGCVGGHLMRIA